MKRQNIFNDNIQAFTLDNFKRLLEADREGFKNLIMPFSRRVITITKANIKNVDRRLLYNWKKNGLIPYREKVDKDKKLWNRFSFIELCWIRVLAEFRDLGVGLDSLKKIKEYLFPPDSLNLALQQIDVNIANDLIPNSISDFKDEGLIKNNQFQRFEYDEDFLEESQFSFFSILLYSTLLTRANQVLYVNKEGISDVINLDAIASDPISGIQEVYDILNKESIAAINIKKIVADLSDAHEHFSNNIGIAKAISNKSVEVLQEAFMKQGVKEVTIRVSEKGRPIVYIKKEMSKEEVMNEVEKLQTNDSFYDLIIKTRDGKVQYFEKTELLKL